MELHCEALTIRANGCALVNQVSMRVAPGEVVGIIGPSGAGKSTLLAALAGVIQSTGTLSVGNRDVRSQSRFSLRSQISYLPQSVEEGLDVSAKEIISWGALDAGKSPEFTERFSQATRLAGVASFLDRPWRVLSGGERKRALVAQAIMQDATFMLLDEPTSALDPAHAQHVFATIASLAMHRKGIVVATHDLHLAARTCSHMLLLKQGAAIAFGPTRDIINDARLHELFGVAFDVSHPGTSTARVVLQ